MEKIKKKIKEKDANEKGERKEKSKGERLNIAFNKIELFILWCPGLKQWKWMLKLN